MKDQRNPPAGPRVLLVLNEALANLVAATLRHGRYETRVTTDPAEAKRLVATWRPHLALIDIDHYEPSIETLGGGLDRSDLPILAFTRRRDAMVKLRAYERGADDIIEVPFTLDEILARPYALMRRAHGLRVPIVPRIKLDSLDVDVIEQRVRVEGRDLDLTPIEQALLYVLAANANAILSRETLLSSIWGAHFQTESNVVDRHVRELRVKLGDDWRHPRYIETVPGRGYRFRSDAAVSDHEAAK